MTSCGNATVTLHDAVLRVGESDCYTGAQGSAAGVQPTCGTTADLSSADRSRHRRRSRRRRQAAPEEIKPPATPVTPHAAVKWMGTQYGESAGVREASGSHRSSDDSSAPTLRWSSGSGGDWGAIPAEDTIVVEYAQPDGITPASSSDHRRASGEPGHMATPGPRQQFPFDQGSIRPKVGKDNEFTLRRDLNQAVLRPLSAPS